MALVKVKPTSAGRRGMLKVVHSELHKGAPYAPLLEKNRAQRVVTTTVTLLYATVVVVINSITVLLISVAIKMVFLRK